MSFDRRFLEVSVGRMSFFEPPEPVPEPAEAHHQPAWLGPADNILGVAVPLRLVLARNDNVVFAITDATAYPNGVEFSLTLRVRSLSGDARRALMHGGPFHHRSFPGDDSSEGIPPEVLRFGVQLADGGRATTLDTRPWRLETAPAGPVLMQRGGSGGDRNWDMRFWLWPLPPPGPLVFVVEWPLGAIPETRVEIDAGPIVEASTHAETLWPDGEVSGGGGWVGQTIVAQSNDRPRDEPGDA
jgi:hypothetical protein